MGTGSTLSSAPTLSSLGLGTTPEAGVAARPRVCPACSGRYPADYRVCPRDATPLSDAPEDADPLVGTTLGGSYEILRVIGEGGMGRVYEARHTRLGNKRFAVKMLHHELARQPEVVARFQREAEAAAAIEHENVVGVFDVNCAPDGRPYIVQELLGGEELGRLLERVGRLPVPAAARVVRQVCRALGAAHARGVVHRDVKPENVILLGDLAAPRVKVVDFGISKLDQGNALTRTGVVMGTPAYMAPEQARGERVDARADVYAAGAILYRAVTGRKPHEGPDAMATLTAVLSEEPPRPRALEPTVPEALELLIQRAMAKEPGERLARIEELERGLAAFDVEPTARTASDPPRAEDATVLAADAATAFGAPSVEAASRQAKRARPLLAVSALAALAFTGLVVGDAVLGAVRWVTDPGRGPTTGEIVLAVVLSLVLLVAPTALALRFLARAVWPSTPRVLEWGRRIRGVLVASAVSYACVALGARAFELVVRRTPAALAHPVWSLAALGVCALVATGAGLLRRARGG